MSVALAAYAVAIGAFLAAYGALQPWAPAPLDYGRDALTVLGLAGLDLVLAIAMLIRPRSRILGVGALGAASAIVVLAGRDSLATVDHGGTILSGLYLVLLGGLTSALAAGVHTANRTA